MKRQYKIVRMRNPNGEEHLRLISGNGEIVMGSENFSKPGNSLRAAKKLQAAAQFGFVIEREMLEAPKLKRKAPEKKPVSSDYGKAYGIMKPKKPVAALLKRKAK